MWQNVFQWISRVCQIKKIKYIHQNLRYYETIVQLLYLSGNHLPLALLMIYKNKMVTPKNLWKISIYWKESVVFLEVILKLYDVCYCFMKNICIAPWTCLHRSDLHIVIMWPENVRRVNKICLHCGHFIHCYFLLNFVLYFSSSLQTVTISNTHVTTEHENKSS